MILERTQDTGPRLPRFEVEAKVVLWPDPNNLCRCLRTISKNISRSGIFLLGHFRIPIGESIRLEIKLPATLFGKAYEIHTRGRIVRYAVDENLELGFASAIDDFESFALRRPNSKVDGPPASRSAA
jgi:hypothetical protein